MEQGASFVEGFLAESMENRQLVAGVARRDLLDGNLGHLIGSVNPEAVRFAPA